MHPHARPTAVGEVLRAVFLTQNLHETPSTGLVHAPFLDFWLKKRKTEHMSRQQVIITSKSGA